MRFFVVVAFSIAALTDACVARAGFSAHLESSVGPGVNSPVYAVQINWTQKQAGGVDVPWLAHSFSSFCIEYHSHVYLGSDYTFQVRTLDSSPVPGSGMGAAKADQIRRLWAGYRLAINTVTGQTSTNGNDGKYSVNEQYAAFQLAIWKILGTTGLATFGNDIECLSNTYVTYSRNTANNNLANLAVLSSGKDSQGTPYSDFQDQVVEIRGGWTPNGFGDMVPTPAPAALILAMTGLVPLFAFGRLRKMVI